MFWGWKILRFTYPSIKFTKLTSLVQLFNWSIYYWSFIIDCWWLIIDCWWLIIDCWLLIVDDWLLIIDYWWLIVDSWLLIIHYWLLIIDCWILMIDSCFFVLDCWWLIVDYWLEVNYRKRDEFKWMNLRWGWWIRTITPHPKKFTPTLQKKIHPTSIWLQWSQNKMWNITFSWNVRRLLIR